MEIQRGVAATLRFPEAGDDPVTLSSPKVTIVKDSDGSTLVNEQAATKVESEEDPHYKYELTGAQVSEVDLLTVYWKDTNSTYTQSVEIVGNFVASIAAIKKQTGLSGSELPTTAEVERERERATLDLEQATFVAFRHRYAKEKLDGNGGKFLPLTHRNVAKIISIEENEELYSQAEINEVIITPAGLERNRSVYYNTIYPRGWRAGSKNIIVCYAYGHEEYPEAKMPVTELAAYRLTPMPTNWNARATSYLSEGIHYNLVTEGRAGAQFPLPSVNAFVARYNDIRVA